MSDDFFTQWQTMERNESETYEGVCHCGTVRYTVTLNPPLPRQKVASCNCSICLRNGYLLVYPNRDQVAIKSGEEALKTYSFGRMRNLHKFCAHCGSNVFFDPRMQEFGDGPPGLDFLGVNVRMFKGVKLEKLDMVLIDGWSKFPFLDDTSHLH
ncbi:Mss4-like protein [Dendryphion nanum]|uniref:Mss4-like protein n=1 Tax=Dendryphion nanum TaxID=256645 RepID=A0A9P9DCY9_9PLEO|nr:Mss4-like protein [Dendryphion nanum]